MTTNFDEKIDKNTFDTVNAVTSERDETVLNGKMYTEMINAGAANLKAHAQEINDLNVFPIPDGDTGDNMLSTIMGGVSDEESAEESIGEAARKASDGMLLSARGNSGVILSQFFEGMASSFSGLDSADSRAFAKAFQGGVTQAYNAVMQPTEGTILTVIREATEYASAKNAETPKEFLMEFIEEAKRSLERTPELLPVLKKAGVVDSGAAGLVYIIDGMIRAICGETVDLVSAVVAEKTKKIDLDAFGADSVLEFGYCTELLLRLMNAKTDVDSFDVKIISDYLQSIGDSVVAVKNGSVIKIHVHTMTPYKVLEFCQHYGEYLTVKIENMSLQHNSNNEEEHSAVVEKNQEARAERKKYGVVAVASGDGVKQTFLDLGCDVVVDGGQSMNPSAETFLEAFDKVNADTIFVFPNNGNIILTAHQAAKLYPDSDVRVIESRTIGDGYAALSMFAPETGDTDAMVAELNEAMAGVVTAEISRCVRDANMDGMELKVGDLIGFAGKKLLASGVDRLKTVCDTVDNMGIRDHDICIVVCGKDGTAEEAEAIERYVNSNYRGKEVYIIDGGQDVYDYIIILE